MTNLVVVAPLAQKLAVMSTPLNGGWGEPATDANGLCAWGVAASLLQPTTMTALSAIPLVRAIANDGAGAWKLTAGWVDLLPTT